jgi:hypothetical protein
MTKTFNKMSQAERVLKSFGIEDTAGYVATFHSTLVTFYELRFVGGTPVKFA